VEGEVREALETIGREAWSRAWPALCFLRWRVKQHVWRTAMKPVKFDGYDVYPFQGFRFITSQADMLGAISDKVCWSSSLSE
jgi:hypothetical protein